VHRDDTSGLGNPPVHARTGVDLGAFLYRNPNPIRVELGLDEDFVFHLWVHLETQKTSKSKRNLKKTQNLKKTDPPPPRKKSQKKLIYKTRQTAEPDPKPDRFRFECQISPTDLNLGVKFNPNHFLQVRFSINVNLIRYHL
jgi:hypothetical protein